MCDTGVEALTFEAAQQLVLHGRGAGEVELAARELGYPDRPVCFKPVFSSGSRGFRILDPTVDRADRPAAAVFLIHLGQAHFRIVGVHLQLRGVGHRRRR